MQGAEASFYVLRSHHLFAFFLGGAEACSLENQVMNFI
jgi:hypothetical protein